MQPLRRGKDIFGSPWGLVFPSARLFCFSKDSFAPYRLGNELHQVLDPLVPFLFLSLSFGC